MLSSSAISQHQPQVLGFSLRLLSEEQGCGASDMWSGHGGSGHPDVLPAKAAVQDEHAGCSNIHVLCAIVAVPPAHGTASDVLRHWLGLMKHEVRLPCLNVQC